MKTYKGNTILQHIIKRENGEMGYILTIAYNVDTIDQALEVLEIKNFWIQSLRIYLEK